MPRWGKAWDQAVTEYPGLSSVLSSTQVADDLSRVIRSAVRAVLPGRQQGKNLADAMLKAERAAVRALRVATTRAAQ
jgi:hypothetical protein